MSRFPRRIDLGLSDFDPKRAVLLQVSTHTYNVKHSEANLDFTVHFNTAGLLKWQSYLVRRAEKIASHNARAIALLGRFGVSIRQRQPVSFADILDWVIDHSAPNFWMLVGDVDDPIFSSPTSAGLQDHSVVRAWKGTPTVRNKRTACVYILRTESGYYGAGRATNLKARCRNYVKAVCTSRSEFSGHSDWLIQRLADIQMGLCTEAKEDTYRCVVPIVFMPTEPKAKVMTSLLTGTEAVIQCVLPHTTDLRWGDLWDGLDGAPAVTIQNNISQHPNRDAIRAALRASASERWKGKARPCRLSEAQEWLKCWRKDNKESKWVLHRFYPVRYYGAPQFGWKCHGPSVPYRNGKTSQLQIAIREHRRVGLSIGEQRRLDKSVAEGGVNYKFTYPTDAELQRRGYKRTKPHPP